MTIELSADAASLQRALELNNRHAVELSFQMPDQFIQLIRMATFAKWCAGQKGFLIALDETAAYRHPNFAWFHDRYARFTYIDRVVIDPAYRGQGWPASYMRNCLST
jgi:predicted GNAT superfamily acetyltransferase